MSDIWGYQDGVVARASASHRGGPGSIPGSRRHKWVEFVVGSRPCSEGFSSGSPSFLPPQNPTLQIPIRSVNEGHRFVSFAVSVPLTKSGQFIYFILFILFYI